jgi:nicotinate-nucleotide adenylyltransferase
MSTARIGYFGGTFDPPHLGHIILAAEAKHFLRLDEFKWIITPEPPHKKKLTISPVENRLEMLKMVIENWEMFEICEVDIQRDPPHYAADTVEILKKLNPEDDLVYIIGEDSLRDLPKWHDINRFIATVDELAIAPRPEITTDMAELEKVLPGISDKTTFIPNVMLEISSSVIRQRVREDTPYEHFLINSVTEYIKEMELYLDGNI